MCIWNAVYANQIKCWAARRVCIAKTCLFQIFNMLSPANKPSLSLKESRNPNAGLKKLNLKKHYSPKRKKWFLIKTGLLAEVHTYVSICYDFLTTFSSLFIHLTLNHIYIYIYIYPKNMLWTFPAEWLNPYFWMFIKRFFKYTKTWFLLGLVNVRGTSHSIILKTWECYIWMFSHCLKHYFYI